MITTLNDVKTNLGITHTDWDTRITNLIPVVEADYLKIRGKAWDTHNGTTLYPDGSDYTAAEMIQWKLRVTNESGVEISNTVGEISRRLQGEKMFMGYPMRIVGAIQRTPNIQ